jgi:hypothetical protein
MPRTKTSFFSSDNFWPNSSKFVTSSIPISAQKKKEALADLLNAVDESPEFYDPYSDLNLFLSQKVKQEMRHCGSSKKWTAKIQEELLERITPDFEAKFPHYRLNISNLKRTWEKVAYYSQQKGALTPKGKLNIPFLIKEGLKKDLATQKPKGVHPFYSAHQLATKVGEGIATIDGVRPELNQLAKLIWAIQRHLLKEEGGNGPYDEHDPLDQQIVKVMLEVLAGDSQIHHGQLQQKVKERLHGLNEESEKKILFWTVQGDMVYRAIRLDDKNPLLHLICKRWEELSSLVPHQTFVDQICQECGSPDLSVKVWMLYKYAWYNLFGSKNESSFDRFLKWHARSLLSSAEVKSCADLARRLEEIVQNALPLTPFDNALFSERRANTPEE